MVLVDCKVVVVVEVVVVDEELLVVETVEDELDGGGRVSVDVVGASEVVDCCSIVDDVTCAIVVVVWATSPLSSKTPLARVANHKTPRSAEPTARPVPTAFSRLCHNKNAIQNKNAPVITKRIAPRARAALPTAEPLTQAVKNHSRRVRRDFDVFVI